LLLLPVGGIAAADDACRSDRIARNGDSFEGLLEFQTGILELLFEIQMVISSHANFG
jgi:hypothetical protein